MKISGDCQILFHFISYLDQEYSRSGLLLQKIRELGIKNRFDQIHRPYIVDIFRLLLKNKRDRTKKIVYVVMSPSHFVVILLKIMGAKNVILDAGWTLTESQLSQNGNKLLSLRVIKNYLVDYLGIHFSNLVFFESQAQIKYVCSTFLISAEKAIKSFTGFNEISYKAVRSEPPLEVRDSKFPSNKAFVLFRGKYNSESGIKFISSLSMELDGVSLVVATNSELKELEFGQTTTLISRHLSYSELKWLYEHASICLGQLSDNPRLNQTIPHKAFEACYFGVPYLTLDTAAVRELLPDSQQAIYIDKLDVLEVKREITRHLGNPSLLKKIGASAKDQYELVASQEQITFNFLQSVRNHTWL